MLQLVAKFNLLQLISCYNLMPFDSNERIKSLKEEKKYFEDAICDAQPHKIPKQLSEAFNWRLLVQW